MPSIQEALSVLSILFFLSFFFFFGGPACGTLVSHQGSSSLVVRL